MEIRQCFRHFEGGSIPQDHCQQGLAVAYKSRKSSEIAPFPQAIGPHLFVSFVSLVVVLPCLTN